MDKKQIHEGHKKRYDFAQEFCNGKEVIDVACGFGAGTDMLAQSARSVLGVDLDTEELAHAMHFYNRDNLKFVRMDGTKMDIPNNSFDVAVSFETIEHLDSDQQHAFLKELQRVVRVGGKIILSTPDHYVWQRLGLSWDQHIKELTKKELLGLMSQYFEVSEVYAQGLLKHESVVRRIVRTTLNFIKGLDAFRLRYKIAPTHFRRMVDSATTPINESDWNLRLISDYETGSHIVVVCINNK